MLITQLAARPWVPFTSGPRASRGWGFLIRPIVVVFGLATVVDAAVAPAVELYTNQSVQSSNRYNPPAGKVAFDDVPVPASLISVAGVNPDAILLDSVTVGIRRLANAPATTVDLYAASFLPGFLTTSFGLNPSTVQKIGTQALAANGSSASTQSLTFALSAAGVRVPLQYANAIAYFAIGLSFGNPDANNGWRIMNTTSDSAGTAYGCVSGTGSSTLNLGCFWRYDPVASTVTPLGGFSSSPSNLPGTFFLSASGVAAPAAAVPAPVPLCGAVAGFRIARKLRSRLRVVTP